MFLIEERIAPNGEARVLIYMRPDGMFEGRLYQRETRNNGQERVIQPLRPNGDTGSRADDRI